MIYSDCGAVDNMLKANHYASSAPDAAAKALNGGTDVDMGDRSEFGSHSCFWFSLYAYIHTNVFIRMYHIYIRAYIHTYTYMHHTYKLMCAYICTITYVHTYILIYLHKCMHTSNAYTHTN